jgi:2-phosphosulfolactate phosphatase
MREGRTLSPASLLGVEDGERLIMPSDNGSVISHAAFMSGLSVVAGSLRNASAVARWLDGRFATVGLVPVGEQWADGAMRVCYEDLIGAGAIASRMAELGGETGMSPEVRAAAAAYRSRESFTAVPSGQELVGRGFAEDVRLAEELDADDVVPLLRDGRYVAAD